jgi:DNA repair protein RecO (recombination protein O)
MPVKESVAIILRSFPLGEGDRLVSFLDRQHGRTRGVARGARLTKSRFGSTLELLSYVRIWYFERENKELVRINQCELIESFLDVQLNYHAGICLALISEITESVLSEREASDAQFRLVLLTARAIRLHGPSSPVLAYFCLWTARLGGWLGPLNRCSDCGRPIESEPLYIRSGSPELSCSNCRPPGTKPISKEALAIGRETLSGTLERLLKGNASLAASNEILSYALDILEHHAERKFNSRVLLEMGELGTVEDQVK